MKTIGIIGGSTHVATAEYYRTITATIMGTLGDLHTGEIIISSMNLHHSARFVHGELWDQGAMYLREKAEGLERAGADFIICVSNTWHRVADVFMEQMTIPLLHIADPTAEAIRAQGLRKVGLLGTKATMKGEYMKGVLRRKGIDVLVPTEPEMDEIDRVIFEELSKDVFLDESRQKYLAIIDRLVAEGAEGVILGCTEIPLLVREADRPGLAMFDTLRLHARAAALMSIEEEIEDMHTFEKVMTKAEVEEEEERELREAEAFKRSDEHGEFTYWRLENEANGREDSR